MTPTIQELCQVMGDIRRTLRSSDEIDMGREFRDALAQVLEDVEGYLVTTEEELARWQTVAMRPKLFGLSIVDLLKELPYTKDIDKPTGQP